MSIVANIQTILHNGPRGRDFIDLRKAFDTAEQKLFLQKLEHYGIIDVGKKWPSTYLPKRK